jgi:hypothetical protein
MTSYANQLSRRVLKEPLSLNSFVDDRHLLLLLAMLLSCFFKENAMRH